MVNILYHALGRVNGIHYFSVYILYDLIPTGRFTQELECGIICRDSWFIQIMIKMYEGQRYVPPKMKLKEKPTTSYSVHWISLLCVDIGTLEIHYIESEEFFLLRS